MNVFDAHEANFAVLVARSELVATTISETTHTANQDKWVKSRWTLYYTHPTARGLQSTMETDCCRGLDINNMVTNDSSW